MIYLTGYRCSGKTAVGKAVAEMCGKEFADTDAEIVREYGMSVKEIVESFGWQNFRKKESKIIEKICSKKDLVVSTGGGVVLDKNNIRLMKKNGIIVWLKASPQTILKRMQADPNSTDFRPRFTSQELIDEIIETLSQREKLYTDTADFVIETDNRSIKEVCAEILFII